MTATKVPRIRLPISAMTLASNVWRNPSMYIGQYFSSSFQLSSFSNAPSSFLLCCPNGIG
ncbi:hypothetical protein ACHHV8_34305 [Paenibacillus sp. TAB 01]|uniref:hypothetical protein n=1 Tax=Paenibacillus sp. TAB 01 TaxID=3368988 RepID=UPI003752D422